ncbi:TPA: tyrosine-type recombinase/integrase [Pseudomonas aeruginosa]|jgi:integrase|uniref:Tyrosine-type recombinase/integrase n=2 Tax=Gammaproteobacteria TaxID=1236 RepID=A0AA40RNK5_STUST|nr:MULTISPECIES: site-specific integrase [Pseudomonadaceae]ELN4741105.1 tyrosine-type recombinase/integrase [Escherichia coli]ELR9005304.1 tyrosine-type recombinase/integrase [Salmonella enterica]HBO0181964.1 tyrosine-type recombinase/integrase [Pseudomonas aeruginosa]EZO30835.1 integrase [Pseudomonas aeruginosa 3574]MBA1302894.1 tyrosine-type recombinase/integrase [Stutzerimonas stutzeri]
MAKIKLTKSAVDAAQPQAQPIELRDTLVPGFLCKITPAGRKVFMLQYRTNAGERRKPALGQYGELTVEQARSLAQEWLAQVRRGGDPAADKAEARKAPTVKELCVKFMEDYSKQRNKPSTQKGYQSVIDRNIIPMIGRLKVRDVKRPDIAGMMKKMAHKPADANRTFGVMRRMFNLAEVWGYRSDGTNPCRHVPMYPNGKATHLISDEDMGRIFRQLDKLEAEGLENYVIPLAIRLQFEFAGRRSEIVGLQWDWVDLENRRVVWPDSKTGGMSKPLSEEAHRLLSTAPRQEGCSHVLPSPSHPGQHLTTGEYYNGWSRVLKAAGATHVGTHGIRHRSATDIANSGIPVKVGMALTAHKTVAMFMRYVHTEDDPVRQAAELVANRRKTITGARRAEEAAA